MVHLSNKQLHIGFRVRALIMQKLEFVIQQGLEIHGLKEHGPWRYTVFNWFPKHLRYTVFGQKP